MTDDTTDTSASRLQRIADIMTGEFYSKDHGKELRVETKISHVSEQAKRLATDALYDISQELNRRRLAWLKIGQEHEAHTLDQAVILIEERAREITDVFAEGYGV